MADRSADSWYPPAAYLYVPQLDGLALAWEYLRRHPDYRRDWLPRLHPEDALSRAHHRAWYGVRFIAAQHHRRVLQRQG